MKLAGVKAFFGVSLWLLAVLSGFGYLLWYQNDPGLTAEAPQIWPQASTLQLDARALTLVMFVHPRCPCTRASLLELNRLLASAKGELATRVVISVPTLAEFGWEETDLLTYSRSLRNTRVVIDESQRETQIFGVHTSGDVVLYNAQGRLLYSGGLTLARAHQGDSEGRAVILKTLRGEAAFHQGVVFGCPIHSPSEFCGQETSTS